MASKSPDRSGGWMIQFVDAAGKRRTIRTGKLQKSAAEEVRRMVERLNGTARAGLPPDAEAARWAAGLRDKWAGKLAAVGLVPARAASALGAFLADYAAGRVLDSKPATVVTIHQVRKDLEGFFGAGTDLRAVTPARAQDFRRHYLERKLAPATAARRLKMCRMLFAHAATRGLTAADPFAGVTVKSNGANPDRQHYVPREDALKVIAVCSPEWQVVVALSRFGGLRAPSEAFSLRVADVDLPAGRMVVRSPKTEHHAGGASRVTPVFPEVRPHLEAALARAAALGSEFVVNGVGERGREKAKGKSGWTGVSLSTPFGKMVRRAGLEAWPKAVHNLRASCETDLAARFPIHVVCAWLGNTPKVALAHYLQTTEADFARAVAGAAESAAPALHNPLQSGAVTGPHGPESRGETATISGPGRLVTAPDGRSGGCLIGQGGT